MARKTKAQGELVVVTVDPAAALPMTLTMPAEYARIEAELAAMIPELDGQPFDLTTDDGLAAAKAKRSRLRKFRTTVEAARVAANEPALTYSRNVNAGAARLTQMITEHEDPLAAKIKARDAEIAEAQRLAEIAEEQRVAGLRQAVDRLRRRPLIGATADSIRQMIAELPATIDPHAWQEATAEAIGALAEARSALTAALALVEREAREKAEREAQAARDKAELDELRRLQAEREARERKAEADRQAAEAEAARAAVPMPQTQAPPPPVAPQIAFPVAHSTPPPQPRPAPLPDPLPGAPGTARNCPSMMTPPPKPPTPGRTLEAPLPKSRPLPAASSAPQTVSARLTIEVWAVCGVCGCNQELVAMDGKAGSNALLLLIQDALPAVDVNDLDLDFRCADCGAPFTVDHLKWA